MSTCNAKSVACLATSGADSGGAGGMSSTAGASGMATAAAGTTAAAGMTATAGSDAGGTSGAPAAGAPAGGSSGAGTAGAAMGGTGGVGTGGSSGAGGTAGTAGKAGAGGTGGAGAGGTGGSAGSAGTGGTSGNAGAGGQAALCVTPVPARTAWTATSNVSMSTGDLPPNAIDTDLGSRYGTGTKMLGGEYLQIDLGAAATVDQLTVLTSNGDYGRHIKIKMSNTAADINAATLTEADGVMGLQTFNFTATSARYILILQTGTVATGQTWWSVYDVNAYCK